MNTYKVSVRSTPRNYKLSQNATSTTVSTKVATVPVTNRLDTLADVVEQAPEDNSTLVYDVETDKYIVKKLSLGDVNGDLDGGSF